MVVERDTRVLLPNRLSAHLTETLESRPQGARSGVSAEQGAREQSVGLQREPSLQVSGMTISPVAPACFWRRDEPTESETRVLRPT
jgi:hypothetical protein